MIRVHDKDFELFISRKQIAARVQELAEQISADYQNDTPLFIAILNGSFMFAADLIRALSCPAEISFVRLASYIGMESGGEVSELLSLDRSVRQRHIVIIEDIVDTGRTLHSYIAQLYEAGAASVNVAAFLSKPEARQFKVPLNYTGFVIPNVFVVGYGLDYDQEGRNYPDIYKLFQIRTP
jgi:hypoxanthine phosphoribosyltransferase